MIGRTKHNLATAEGQQALVDELNAKNKPPSIALPDGAGPADWWLAVLIDPTASQTRRDEAAKELRGLGPRAIREAQARREAMEEDRWWASLSEAEQRELLRKGQGPKT
jgi:hypothetical protein